VQKQIYMLLATASLALPASIAQAHIKQQLQGLVLKDTIVYN